MSIEKEIPSTKKIARSYEITINKSDPENPIIEFRYTNDEEDLGSKKITPQEVVEEGILTAEAVQEIEDNLRIVANFISPYNEGNFDD